MSIKSMGDIINKEGDRRKVSHPVRGKAVKLAERSHFVVALIPQTRD
jgi:hypothetical protein